MNLTQYAGWQEGLLKQVTQVPLLLILASPVRGQLGTEGEQGIFFGDWGAGSALQLVLAAVDEALEVVQFEGFEVG